MHQSSKNGSTWCAVNRWRRGEVDPEGGQRHGRRQQHVVPGEEVRPPSGVAGPAMLRVEVLLSRGGPAGLDDLPGAGRQPVSPDPEQWPFGGEPLGKRDVVPELCRVRRLRRRLDHLRTVAAPARRPPGAKAARTDGSTGAQPRSSETATRSVDQSIRPRHGQEEIARVDRPGEVVRRGGTADREGQRRVTHGACQRPVHREGRPAAEAGQLRDQPEGRLVTHQTAERSRNPDRAAAIGPERHRRRAVGHGRTRPTARTTRGAVQRPRVAGQAPQVVVGVAAVAELRVVGLPDDDGPGRLESRHRHGILGGDEVTQGLRAVGGRHPSEPDVVLHRDRHPIQRRQPRLMQG